jgi:predicted nucleotide-binding protein
MAKSTGNGTVKKASEEPGKRTYMQQSMLPKRKLRDAMLIPQAIVDNFGRSAAPHQVAMAIDSSPTSSSWRDLTGAAIAYGLTDGGYNSDQITLTELGRRCVAPTSEGDEVRARSEAALRPLILRQFFEKYDRNKFPEEKIARNVLQHDFQVPSDRLDEVFDILKENGSYVGILHNTKTGLFVAIGNPEPSASISLEVPPSQVIEHHAEQKLTTPPEAKPLTASIDKALSAFKVFISHGKNMDVVSQVKDVLGLYDIEFEVAVEEETTAIPVSDKVLNGMRACQAGVMVVTADEQAKVGADYAINNNVLIEIGAAFVLYNKRVVLLWDKRLKVPSNLSGLYRCEFEGNELSFAIGTKLAKAVKAFRGG